MRRDADEVYTEISIGNKFMRRGNMRKKLVCVLVSIGMLLSALTVSAAEVSAESGSNEAEEALREADAGRIEVFDEVYEYDAEIDEFVLQGRDVENDELVREGEDLPKIDTPTDARWETSTGTMFFSASANGTGIYHFAIYNENEKEPIYEMEVHYSSANTEKRLKFGLSDGALAKMETGRYYFTVTAEGNDDYRDSDPCKSDILEYKRPDRQLSAPYDLKWNITIATWSLPENASIAYELECKKEGSSEWEWAASGFTGQGRNKSNHIIQHEFTKDMNEKGIYRFRIKALSNDIFDAVDSEWSEWSPEISSEDLTSEVAKELKELLAKGANADEILDALESKDKKELSASVQSDPVARDYIKKAEQKFAEEKGISVNTAVTPDMKDKLSGDVTILGAAFNAGDNVTSMTLNVTKPDLERDIDRQQYKNVVQISMVLDGAADTQNLKVPVRITMPVPAGVDPVNLQILHYHNDGTYEAIIFPHVEDNMVSFTLTSFSTFVFANKADGGDTPTPGPSENWPFTDVAVNPGNWKYENIRFVNEKGVMTGVNAREFQPDAPLTRAQFASVIYRMAGSPKVTYQNVFKDVLSGKWYSNAIIWAYENKIVAGLGEGRYGIDDNITREQMARMLMEFAKVQKYDVSDISDFDKFADASQVSRWAADNMRWAVGSGIISGSTKDGKYYMNPKGNATRAECAVMLTKFIQKYQ